MNNHTGRAPAIGLIESPATGLYDSEGKNWTSLYRHRSLISKQVFLADLQAGGFDAQLVNLRDENCCPMMTMNSWQGLRRRSRN